MLLKDLIRDLTKIKKKHPEAPVYLFGDKGDLENVQHTVVCYAPSESVQNNTVSADVCQKDYSEGYETVIVIG